MNKKYKLTVCCGTACYLAEGDRIDRLEKLIEEEFGSKIEVKPSACIGQCAKQNMPKDFIPPFVRFDDEIIPNATDDKIINVLKSRL